MSRLYSRRALKFCRLICCISWILCGCMWRSGFKMLCSGHSLIPSCKERFCVEVVGALWTIFLHLLNIFNGSYCSRFFCLPCVIYWSCLFKLATSCSIVSLEDAYLTVKYRWKCLWVEIMLLPFSNWQVTIFILSVSHIAAPKYLLLSKKERLN